MSSGSMITDSLSNEQVSKYVKALFFNEVVLKNRKDPIGLSFDASNNTPTGKAPSGKSYDQFKSLFVASPKDKLKDGLETTSDFFSKFSRGFTLGNFPGAMAADLQGQPINYDDELQNIMANANNNEQQNIANILAERQTAFNPVNQFKNLIASSGAPRSVKQAGPFIRPPESIQLTTERDNVLSVGPKEANDQQDLVLSRLRATLEFLIKQKQSFGDVTSVQMLKAFFEQPFVRYSLMTLGFFGTYELARLFYRHGRRVDDSSDDEYTTDDDGDDYDDRPDPPSPDLPSQSHFTNDNGAPAPKPPPPSSTNPSAISTLSNEVSTTQQNANSLQPIQTITSSTHSSENQTSQPISQAVTNTVTTLEPINNGLTSPASEEATTMNILENILKGLKRAYTVLPEAYTALPDRSEGDKQVQVLMQKGLKMMYDFMSKVWTGTGEDGAAFTNTMSDIISNGFSSSLTATSSVAGFSWQLFLNMLERLNDLSFNDVAIQEDLRPNGSAEPHRLVPATEPGVHSSLVNMTNSLTMAQNQQSIRDVYSSTYNSVLDQNLTDARQLVESRFRSALDNAQGLISNAYEEVKTRFESMFGEGATINNVMGYLEKIQTYYTSSIVGNSTLAALDAEVLETPDIDFGEFDIGSNNLKTYIQDNFQSSSVDNQITGEQGGNDEPIVNQQLKLLNYIHSNAHEAAEAAVAGIPQIEPEMPPMSKSSIATDIFKSPPMLFPINQKPAQIGQTEATDPKTDSTPVQNPDTSLSTDEVTLDNSAESKESFKAQENPDANVEEGPGNAVQTIASESTDPSTEMTVYEPTTSSNPVSSEEKKSSEQPISSTQSTISTDPIASENASKALRYANAFERARNGLAKWIWNSDSRGLAFLNPSQDIDRIDRMFNHERIINPHLTSLERLDELFRNAGVEERAFNYALPRENKEAKDIKKAFDRRQDLAKSAGITYLQYMHLLGRGFINETNYYDRFRAPLRAAELDKSIVNSITKVLGPNIKYVDNPYELYSQMFYGKPHNPANQSESDLLPLSYLADIQKNAEVLASLSERDPDFSFKVFDTLLTKSTGLSSSPIANKFLEQTIDRDPKLVAIIKEASSSKDPKLAVCGRFLLNWVPPASQAEAYRTTAGALTCALLLRPKLDDLKSMKEAQYHVGWYIIPTWMAGLVGLIHNKLESNKLITFASAGSAGIVGALKRYIGSGIRKPIGKIKQVYYHPTEKSEIAQKIASLPAPSLKLRPKNEERCGACGGYKNLLVHDEDPKDITCGSCYETNQSTSGGRFYGGQMMQRIEDSPNHNYHNDAVKHNAELIATLDQHKPSSFDNFLATSPQHIKNDRWQKMYGKTYAQHGKVYGPKDLDRLTFLLGAKHHAPELLTPLHKANLVGLGIKHMHSFSDVNSYHLPISAFKDFNELKGGLVKHPRIFEHLTI